MLRSPRFLLPLMLIGALTACGQDNREKQIDKLFPLEQNYQTTVDSIVPPFAAAHPNVPEEKVKEVVRKHFTYDEYRKDIYKLYSEEHFTDAELKQMSEVLKDPVKTQELGKTPETKALGAKLNGYILETVGDEKLREEAEVRVKAIGDDLKAIDKK